MRKFTKVAIMMAILCALATVAVLQTSPVAYAACTGGCCQANCTNDCCTGSCECPPNNHCEGCSCSGGYSSCAC